MKMRKKCIRNGILVCVMASLMLMTAGCSETEPMSTGMSSTGTVADTTELQTEEQTQPEQTEPVTEAVTTEETVTTEEISTVYNPLTGEYGYNENAVGKRPVAVMINNIDLSLPQYGIGSADYIYEVVVEGGITRLMAVFADYTSVPDLCSIRSCRYYYPIIAHGLDAIYCHWGADQTIAQETLDRLDIDRFDGGSSTYYDWLFLNDEQRLLEYSSEHTGYLKGSVLAEAIEYAGYRTDMRNGAKDAFVFAEGDEVTTFEGTPCTMFDVIFSESYYSTFTYDEENKTYKKQHSGDPHMDSATDEQLSFTNVFVLETSVSMRGVGELMDVALEGGTGYYISGGKSMPINWTKPAENENFVITDLSGQPITVNRGKCYFGITDKVEFF